MHGWTLDTVRSLSVTDYDEIIRWLKDEAEAAERGGEPSVDMDALLAERRGERKGS